MTMIDRVAHAIHAALAGEAPAWETLHEESRDAYRRAAHRAIGAMRVPTSPMLHEGDRRDLARDAANIWERMVFAALSGPR
jgi:hypothetical protein